MNPENDDSISKDRNQISEKYKEIFKTYKELTIREFVNKYKDDIICEPSGRTYSELIEARFTKMMIVNK